MMPDALRLHLSNTTVHFLIDINLMDSLSARTYDFKGLVRIVMP